MNNCPLRLLALRQTSTIVLSNSHHKKYVYVADRVLLGGLAARNARDLPAFHQAYDLLVTYAQDILHPEAICSELVQIRIHHFNLIDVVYELVLMGVMQGSRPPIFTVRDSVL
ncbi:hypothetical protein AOLI_G00215600 [Acnodon oligacanthus]